MRKTSLLLTLCVSLIFISCSKLATDVYNGDDYAASDINGTWKEPSSGFVVRISGVSSSGNGYGTVVSCGSAFPSSAQGGTCMTEVEYHDGGYFDAYNWSYTGSSWYQSSVIGLSMINEDQFMIGSKTYTRQ